MADKKEIKLEEGVVGTIEGDTIKFTNAAFNKFGEARGISDIIKTQKALVDIYGEAAVKITPACSEIIRNSAGKIDAVHVDFGQAVGSSDYDYLGKRKVRNPQTQEEDVHYGVGRLTINMPTPTQLSKDEPVFKEESAKIKDYFDKLK